MTGAAKVKQSDLHEMARAAGFVLLPASILVPYRSGTLNRKLNLGKLADHGILQECTEKAYGNWGDDMLGKASLTDEDRRTLTKKRHEKMEGGTVPENGAVADPILSGIREHITLNRSKYRKHLKKMQTTAKKATWKQAKSLLGEDFERIKADETDTVNRRKGIIVSR